jgi:hypothetical protein
MDEGLGRIEVRFGAVEERRFSGAGRAGAGWADMMSVVEVVCGLLKKGKVHASRTRYGFSVSPCQVTRASVVHIRVHRTCYIFASNTKSKRRRFIRYIYIPPTASALV